MKRAIELSPQQIPKRSEVISHISLRDIIWRFDLLHRVFVPAINNMYDVIWNYLLFLFGTFYLLRVVDSTLAGPPSCEGYASFDSAVGGGFLNFSNNFSLVILKKLSGISV